MVALLLAVTGILVAAFHLLGRFLSLSHDPKEPPLIRPSIPYIGHVIGLLRYGTGYYSKISKECGQPIFTLALPRGKMYVVTSPSLITACDRRAKVVSFAPYVVEFGRRILMGSPPSIELLSVNLLEEKGPVGLRPETMRAMRESLMPGNFLDKTMEEFLKNVLSTLDSVTGKNSADQKDGVPLFGWLRRFVTIASTNAIYGTQKNPLRDPAVMDGFWAVDKDFALLGMMVYPDLVAPQGSSGRKRFFDGFRKYYAAGEHETASDLIKARHAVNSRHGVSDEDIARFDLGVCTALLVNTVPAIGWTLCHVFSKPALLAELRQGLEAIVFSQGKPEINEAVSTTVTVNIPQIMTAFPLLDSLVREVLRVQSTNASARFVLKDTLIDDGAGSSYLLKKDSSLVMPSAPVHASEAAWGPTAQTFDPARFLKEQQKTPAAAWRTFGGGNALCPGRHFAMHEIVSILIIMVLRYDVKPCASGAWEIPATKHHISTSILTPMHDIRVRIHPREEVSNIDLDFIWEPEKDRN